MNHRIGRGEGANRLGENFLKRCMFVKKGFGRISQGKKGNISFGFEKKRGQLKSSGIPLGFGWDKDREIGKNQGQDRGGGGGN